MSIKREYPRIVFMGTPEFAVASLKAIVDEGFNVVGVVTVPDKPAGRGRQLKQSPVKEYALNNNITVLQPEKLKDPSFIDDLKGLRADLQVIVAFRMLPEVVWAMPKLGSFNLHGSLLPQYRGAAPINWAIINGDSKSGVTTFFLKHEIDTGNIIFSEETPITDDDTAGSLHDRLMQIGQKLVIKTISAIIDNTIQPTPQTVDGQNLKGAPKIFKDDCRIDWSKSSDSIINLIRGLSPYPAAWSELVMPSGTTTSLKVFKAKKCISKSLSIGEVKTDGKTFIMVGSKNCDIELVDILIAGKKHLPIVELLRGFKIEDGAVLK